MSSPFDIEKAKFMGRPSSEFACAHCGEGGQTWIVMSARTDYEKPSYVMAYTLCGRCASLYWEEAGKKFFDCLRRDIGDGTP